MKSAIITLLVLIFSSCAKLLSVGQPILSNNKHKKLIKTSYDNAELNWRSYIYFHDSSFQYRSYKEKLLLNYQDSVVGIVKDAFLRKNQISFIYSDKLENKVNSDISKLGPYLKPHRKLTDDMILIHVPDSKSYLFPIIVTSFSHSSRPSYGYTGGWLYNASDQIYILVYIICDKQVIYKRACRLFASRVYDIASKDKLIKIVENEHWQLIIDKALEDYIKRLKVPTDAVKSKN